MVFFFFCLCIPVGTYQRCWGINLITEQKRLCPSCSTSSPTVPKWWPPPGYLPSASSYGYLSHASKTFAVLKAMLILIWFSPFYASLSQHTHVPRLIPLITSNCTSKSVAVRRYGQVFSCLIFNCVKYLLWIHFVNLEFLMLICISRRCYDFLDLLLQEWQTHSLERWELRPTGLDQSKLNAPLFL